jgi:hypothetical protein
MGGQMGGVHMAKRYEVIGTDVKSGMDMRFVVEANSRKSVEMLAHKEGCAASSVRRHQALRDLVTSRGAVGAVAIVGCLVTAGVGFVAGRASVDLGDGQRAAVSSVAATQAFLPPTPEATRGTLATVEAHQASEEWADITTPVSITEEQRSRASLMSIGRWSNMTDGPMRWMWHVAADATLSTAWYWDNGKPFLPDSKSIATLLIHPMGRPITRYDGDAMYRLYLDGTMQRRQSLHYEVARALTADDFMTARRFHDKAFGNERALSQEFMEVESLLMDAKEILAEIRHTGEVPAKAEDPEWLGEDRTASVMAWSHPNTGYENNSIRITFHGEYFDWECYVLEQLDPAMSDLRGVITLELGPTERTQRMEQFGV